MRGLSVFPCRAEVLQMSDTAAMKKRSNRFLFVSAVCIVVLGVIVFTSLARTMGRKSETTLSGVTELYMAGMNSQLQQKFEILINMQLDQLDGVIRRSRIAVSDGPKKLEAELNQSARIRGFTFLALYRRDGSHEIIYGETVNPAAPEEFEKMLTEPEIRMSYGCTEAGERVLLLGIDAKYPMDEGAASDLLVAGVSMEYMKKVLALDEKDSELTSHIISSDGTFVIRSGAAFRDNYFDRIRAVFQTYNGKTPVQYEEELKKAMEAHAPYSARAMIDGVRQNIYCSMLDQTDWFLLSVMPYGTLDRAVSSLNFDRTRSILISSGIIFVCFLLIFIQYYRMSHEQLEDLRMAEQKAVKASMAKSEFLSSMSHDIRTPMNGIVGMTAIAQANINDPARVTNCLAKIALSSKHLLGLINDILDMSKIESGKLSLNTHMVSLRETMDSIVNIAQPQIKAKGQIFDIFIQDIRTENVWCDSVRLNQILLNLLSNAIKFTPEGGSVHVYLKQEDSPRGGAFVRCQFRVKDSGIGMTEEFQKQIFEKFSREQNQQVYRTEGSGLGMAITKAIVDAMGGTIEITSAPGEGSEFIITLDFERAAVQEMDMVLPPWRMLVVDDDEDLCRSAIASLKEIGIQAEWATGGERAVELAEKHHETGDDYQIILLDWKMPGMDGLATVRNLRKTLGSEAPILIISAYDWSDIEDEARAAGAQGFISKPLFKSNLFLGLSPYMLSSESEKAPEAQKARQFAGKRILLAEDNDLNWEIASEILSDEGFVLDRAENGLVCVELFSKSEVGHYDAILMDIRMPVMNGYDAAKNIRALDRADANLPIIAMTADAFSDDIQRSKECGMNEHIAKPIDIERLMQILSNYIT